MSSTLLAPPRVVTASHSPNGTSIISSDGLATPFFPFGKNNSSFVNIHSADQLPVSNTTPVSSALANTVPRAPAAGVMFTTTDFQPGGGSPMHRTLSLDYAVVLSGEITMKLDGGDETIIKSGDYILQQGTMHQWYNHTKEPCRILVVLVGSEKVVTEDGKELEAYFPPPAKKD